MDKMIQPSTIYIIVASTEGGEEDYMSNDQEHQGQ
jgi:hypothetical protein